MCFNPSATGKSASKELERIDQFFYTYANNSSGVIEWVCLLIKVYFHDNMFNYIVLPVLYSCFIWLYSRLCLHIKERKKGKLDNDFHYVHNKKYILIDCGICDFKDYKCMLGYMIHFHLIFEKIILLIKRILSPFWGRKNCIF